MNYYNLLKNFLSLKSTIRLSALFFLFITILSILFEFLNHFILPDKISFEAYTLTVTISSILAATISYIIFGKAHKFRQSIKAENLFLEMEERYNIFFDNAPDAILILKGEGEEAGKIVAANKAAAKMHLYNAEDLLGIHISELNPPEDNESIPFLIEQLTDGNWKQIEINHKKKDGTVFTVECYVGLINIGGKKYVMRFDRNISDRKILHGEIKMLVHALKSVSECVSITDMNDKVLFVNTAFLKTYGFEKHEILGKSISIVRSDKNLPGVVREILPATLAGGWQGEIFNKRKDKTHFPIHLSTSVIRDEQNLPIALIGVAVDITECKKVDEKISLTLSLLNATLESTADGIFVVDVNGKITNWNGKFAKMWNIPSELIQLRNNKEILSFILNQLKNSESFINKVMELDSNPSVNSYDILELKDNRTFERYSYPQHLNDKIVGRVWSFREITEQKKAEEAIRRSEMRFRIVWENSEDGMRLLDENGIIILVNKAFCDLVGMNRHELLNKPFAVTYSLDMLDVSIEKYKERFQSRDIITNTKEFITLSNNKKVWLEISSSFVEMEDNQLYVLSIFRDFTEREMDKEQVKTSELKFRTLFEDANDGIFLMSEDKFIDCNSKAEKMFGVTHDKIISQKPYDFSPPFQPDGSNSRDKALERIKLTMQGQPQIFEWQHIRIDGTAFDVEVNLTLVNVHGQPLIQAILRDISERKRSERVKAAIYKISEAARLSENLMDLYRTIHLTVSFLMPAKNFYLALYDDASNLISFPYFIDEKDDPPKSREFRKGLTEYVLDSGIPLLISPKKIVELENGGKIEQIGSLPKNWLGVPLKVKDKTIGVIVVQSYTEHESYTDVEKDLLTFVSTQIAMAIESKRAEEELKISEQQLRDLNSNKDKLFSIIAHDLRGPFHPLLGLSEILANETDSLTTKEIKSFSKEIYANLHMQYKLLENLLEWSRIQTGVIKYAPVKVDLYEKVNECINISMSNAQRKNIILENKIIKPTYVNGDPNMLQSIIQNLIMNAIKFTHAEGYISVYQKNKGDEIEVYVEDNGIGIKENDIDSLFRIDTNITTSGTHQEKGTGLGLIICKDMVEKHNGKIWVESESGKGSKFIFTLKKYTEPFEEQRI